MTFGAGIINGDVRISSNAADAGFTIVGLTIQSATSLGLRAQVQNTAVQGLFSATAPVLYSAGVFSFDTATTTLTAYLLKTGGTMTGQITNNSGFANTGLSTAVLQPSTNHSVNNLETTTITFSDSGPRSYQISLAIQGYPSLVFSLSRHLAQITVLTDQENLYLESDAGTGIYITKSATSNVVTIKSRLGTSHNIFVIIERGLVSSATAWA